MPEEVVTFASTRTREYITVLLDSSTVQADLRSTKTNAIIAFQTGVPLPRWPSTPETRFCTRCCAMRRLYARFLANIKLSAERRYTVRCSATTAIANAATPKYLMLPEDRKLAKSVLRTAGLEPVSTHAARQWLSSPRCPALRNRLVTVRLQDHPSVTYISTHKELGLVARLQWCFP